MKINVTLSDEALMPRYATPGAAGADLYAYLPNARQITIAPGAYVLVDTGMAVELPEGYEMQIRPRSGLAFKHGVTVLNAPGTIDSDYRGSVGVLLINHGSESFVVKHGDRIAQAVVAAVGRVEEFELDVIREERGTGGFGSTGKDNANG